MLCNKCQGPTQVKNIQSKKNGNIYTVYECQVGCVSDQNPNWKHSFFPPKNGEGQKLQQAKPQSGTGTQILENQKRIITLLSEIKQAVTGKVSVEDEELQPDENVPPF